MIDAFSGRYRILSNFFPSPIVVSGLEYPTVEHAYQAMKTPDPNMRELIRLAPTASKAKHFGRIATLRPNWDEERLGIMRLLLQKKFVSGSELAEELLATHPHELVEGNHWNDTFWGVCRGKGENHLGRLLMEIREELRREQ